MICWIVGTTKARLQDLLTFSASLRDARRKFNTLTESQVEAPRSLRCPGGLQGSPLCGSGGEQLHSAGARVGRLIWEALTGFRIKVFEALGLSKSFV